MRMTALIVLVVISALGVVYSKYKSRLLFGEIQHLQTRIQQAEVDRDNLLLEYTMLAGRNELERKATKELGMIYPDPESIIYLSLQN
ncbi:MAG TPA: cell division protein FtsL [Crenotrichaceae bacterium]|nr:cell division protein FtsL [Crenotrichaceae bacterium]